MVSGSAPLLFVCVCVSHPVFNRANSPALMRLSQATYAVLHAACTQAQEHVESNVALSVTPQLGEKMWAVVAGQVAAAVAAAPAVTS